MAKLDVTDFNFNLADSQVDSTTSSAEHATASKDEDVAGAAAAAAVPGAANAGWLI